MLRVTENAAPGGAKSYYSTADYYAEGQESVGVWRGLAAARLGLAGAIQKPDWDALCDNRNPATGERLTARTKQNRRVGYDFNFHAPKSVSLLYGLTGDERIRDLFREAVDATMQDIEAEMQTRVRSGGEDTDRVTGNMVWGEFLHFTARPVEGVPDPHLHAHCFVFNSTFDVVEGRWKAGQFAGLKRDASYFEACFHSRLAAGLEALGLRTARTARGWEIADVPASALRKFSRRTALIEARAKAKGITDPKEKGDLGAQTREPKTAELTMPELREEWAKRLTPDEESAIRQIAARSTANASRLPDRDSSVQAVCAALAHLFERSSVVSERSVLTHALKRSTGRASITDVKAAFARTELLRARYDGEDVVTSAQVLEEERRMVDFARRGRGACTPMKDGAHCFSRDWLNAGQRRAVEHVLNSRDRVTLVRGAAGVGKTAMMQEAVEAIEHCGKRVLALAPSAAASRGVLRDEGFETADTVARFLVDAKFQETARGQVLWVDEAGLLGTPTLAKLFEKAEELRARVVLSGDRRQHASVERGSPLALLESEAGLIPTEIRSIQRQRGEYKRAVEALSEGRTAQGFKQLNALGWIREVADRDRYQLLASDYVKAVSGGQTALVVSPTHYEGGRITENIRDTLKKRGAIGKAERLLPTLVPANLTESERRDPGTYSPGDVLVFHQNGKGFKRGEQVIVETAPLPLEQADKFQVFHPQALPVSAGDRIRITRNGKTVEGARLNNGSLHTVRSIAADGALVLENGQTVPAGYGHLTHGYVVTSHASQGRTVDHVLIGQSSTSFRASSREQFYVSVSRGRKQATIYTDSKAALAQAVEFTEPRISAIDLMARARDHARGRVLMRMDDQARYARESGLDPKAVAMAGSMEVARE